MTLPTTTIDGRLVADPELRFTNASKAVCSFRVAASDSRKDDAGNWETTEQIFVSVSLWEADGEAAAEALSKGDRVIVTGRIFQREYEHNGEKRTSLEMKFPSVGKVIKGRTDRQATPTQRTQQPGAADPWAVPTAGRDEPPF